ncbi:hypothetical protein ABIE50_004870 [Chitinophaga sp. OAE865]
MNGLNTTVNNKANKYLHTKKMTIHKLMVNTFVVFKYSYLSSRHKKTVPTCAGTVLYLKTKNYSVFTLIFLNLTIDPWPRKPI